jgi:acetyl-CoA carboxylase, biotin carboxylase subunit
MIKKILVANRGEIAIRIMRTCREMNIKSVAVYSDADRKSMHVSYADEAYYIGASPAKDSYLNIEKIISAAKESGADAIHPGYGFLSENALFAERCEKEGIIFIGPSAYAIRTMGDKITARETVIKNGVPVVPGINESIENKTDLLIKASETGYPLMVKASAGGGGKGMRMVKSEAELISALEMAQSEAKAAFGNDTVYIEKYIESPHHIEFQILADKYGNTVHLFERECSVQRRHQKIIEETPSPLLTNEMRQKMGEMAVAAAKSVNYYGAGTIEFLADNTGNFYFLEMNTRLQVEHPITEFVTGIDLVREQIKIADNQKLGYIQNDITQTGHSIECRVYAEDPNNNFRPSPGKVSVIRQPMGAWIRIDGYLYKDFEIPVYYDPMISKLIVWGKTRTEAIARMRRALHEYKITGFKNTIHYLELIMQTPDFVEGKYDTHFIENNEKYLKPEPPENKKLEDLAAIVTYLHYLDNNNKQDNIDLCVEKSKWKTIGRFQSI